MHIYGGEWIARQSFRNENAKFKRTPRSHIYFIDRFQVRAHVYNTLWTYKSGKGKEREKKKKETVGINDAKATLFSL